MRAYIVTAAFILVSNVNCSALESLKDRFKRLSCAVVHLEAMGSSGTGFFINGDGEILTAAHVLVDRQFTVDSEHKFVETITLKNNARATKTDAQTIVLPPQVFSQRDLDNATHDLMIVKTNTKQTCFLDLGDSEKLEVGNHLIGIGFPGSTPTGVLYEGFLSARHSQIHSIGPIIGNPSQVATNTYDVLRVQMPITPGASGSPIISDEDVVIGVMSEIPVASLADVNLLIDQQLSGQVNARIVIGGADALKLLAEVAYLVREFESPGSGLAVPISLLRR